MTLEICIVSLLAYFLGCLPSALIIVRLMAGKDIREVGTGNVGAMNSFETTGKKTVGLLVFLLDALKGFLAILAARLICKDDYIAVSLAAVLVVTGHNFNVFLKFKGGRGLASAAGSFLYINPFLVIAWLMMFLFGFLIIKKHVHVGNIVATLTAPLVIYLIPEKLLSALQFIPFPDKFTFVMLCAAVCFVVFLRHIKPLMDLFKTDNQA